MGGADDIDSLKNRKIRTSGELIQMQIAIGLVRLEKTIRDKMKTILWKPALALFLFARPQQISEETCSPFSNRPFGPTLQMGILDYVGNPKDQKTLGSPIMDITLRGAIQF
jgi:DNA-directed RNA polymerase beta subunit